MAKANPKTKPAARKARAATAARPRRKIIRRPAEMTESDSVYLLKLVIYVILGTLWLKFQSPISFGAVQLHGLPIGLFIGMIFASHDHFQVNRKIAYAILIVMTVLSYFLPAGIVI